MILVGCTRFSIGHSSYGEFWGMHVGKIGGGLLGLWGIAFGDHVDFVLES